jgi:hypothetical protein
MRRCRPALESGHIVIAEEPTALIGHGGVCEEGGRNCCFRLPLLGRIRESIRETRPREPPSTRRGVSRWTRQKT